MVLSTGPVQVTWERLNHLGMDRSPTQRPDYDPLSFDEHWHSYQTKDDHAAFVEQYLEVCLELDEETGTGPPLSSSMRHRLALQEIRGAGLDAAIVYMHHNRGLLVASHPHGPPPQRSSQWYSTDMPL
eukprot:scaffold624_cov402-Prasinococcus_capsulatus_cf.AAC.30